MQYHRERGTWCPRKNRCSLQGSGRQVVHTFRLWKCNGRRDWGDVRREGEYSEPGGSFGYPIRRLLHWPIRGFHLGAVRPLPFASSYSVQLTTSPKIFRSRRYKWEDDHCWRWQQADFIHLETGYFPICFLCLDAPSSWTTEQPCFHHRWGQ